MASHVEGPGDRERSWPFGSYGGLAVGCWVDGPAISWPVRYLFPAFAAHPLAVDVVLVAAFWAHGSHPLPDPGRVCQRGSSSGVKSVPQIPQVMGPASRTLGATRMRRPQSQTHAGGLGVLVVPAVVCSAARSRRRAAPRAATVSAYCCRVVSGRFVIDQPMLGVC